MKILIKEKALEMLRQKLSPGEFLRVTFAEGGCAGLTYAAEIGSEMTEDEGVVFESETIRVVSNKANMQYLEGLIIDYSDNLIGGGLQFTNANAKATCGCGASFNLTGFPVIETGKCGS